jgi:hypothetical protein
VGSGQFPKLRLERRENGRGERIAQLSDCAQLQVEARCAAPARVVSDLLQAPEDFSAHPGALLADDVDEQRL